MADPAPYTAANPIGPLGLIGNTPVPVIDTRTEGQYFNDVTTPAGLKPVSPDAATPAPPDPFAGYADAPDPFAGYANAPDQFANFKTADDLDVHSTEDLIKDREKFNPVDYFSNNPDSAKDPKKLQKLLDIYRKRREEGLSISGVAKAAVKETPGIIGGIAKGALKLVENGIDVTVQPIFNAVVGGILGDMADPEARKEFFKGPKKSLAEISAGSESAATGLVDIARQGLRKLENRPGEVGGELPSTRISRVTPPVKPKSDQELLAEISADVAFRNNADAVINGSGEAAKNFGLDAETLQKQGITLDKDAIQNLSLVDPVSLLAVGGAFKLVGAGGRVIATARTLEAAEQAVEKFGKLAKFTGGALEKAGKVAADTQGFSGRGMTTVGALIGAAGGGGKLSGAVGAGIAKVVTKGLDIFALPSIKEAGAGVAQAGKIIAGKVPLSEGSAGVQRFVGAVEGGNAVLRAGGSAAKNLATSAAKGAAAAAPFVLSTDEDTTAGALLGAGIALGAGGATVEGTRNQFRVLKNEVAQSFFGPNRKTIPDVPSPAYGRDAALDSQHSANIQKLSVQDASELNNFREGLRNLGGEIYAVDRDTFRQKVSEVLPNATPEQLNTYENHSAFFDDSTGDRKIVYLNSDATGLRHDAGHIFDALLSPEKRAELRDAVTKTFTPESIKEFRDTYERRVGNKISDAAAVDEFIAETFGALFHNVPVSDLAAPGKLLRAFAGVLAEGAEALGIDLTGGIKTPNLQAPQTVGLQGMFESAARDVLKAGKETAPAPPNVTKLPPPPPGAAPTPTPAPAGPGPVAPPTNVVPLNPPPANVIPLTPARPIRTTPEAPKTPEARAAAAKRYEVTGIGPAKELAAKLADPVGIRAVEEISAQMESGNPVLEVEHLGIRSEGTPATPEGRTSRRATQAAAYEVLKGELSRAGAPEDLVNRHIKTFVPVRWEPQGGSPTLIAMSLDKVLTNLKEIAKDPKAKDLIPYPVETIVDPITKESRNRFTEQGWRDAVSDFQKYAENQSNGRKGDGGLLNVPEAGELSIPVENREYVPQPLSPEKSDFMNLMQGLETPGSSKQGSKGTKFPTNIKGQFVAEANQRPLELPAKIPVKKAGSQAFVNFPGRVVQEVNPLRNRMKEAGIDTGDLLHKVTERIRAQDIEKVTPRPDLNFKAPVTDIIQGGFLPNPTEFRHKNLQGRTVEEFSDSVLKATPEQWKALTDNMTGGLTGGAWNLGLGLKNAADVSVLKSYADKFSDSAKAAMKAGDFDSAFSQVTRGQFFREAYEAATGTGSAGAAFKRGAAGMETAKPPFPVTEKTQATATVGGDTTTVTIGEGGAQFLPAEELGTIEQPPELRIVPRQPAAAGGTPPIEPPSGTVIPPPVAAGRFQPAEQIQQDEQHPELKVVPKEAAIPSVLPTGRGLIPPPVAAREQKDEDSGKFLPAPSKEIQDLAKEYADNAGLPYTPKGGYAEINPDLSKRLAKFYEDAKSDPTNPEVAKSYAALIKETEDQGKAILAAGYKIEPWAGAGEPYKDSASAIADVRDNKHLFFRKTSDSFGTGESNVGNPMLAESNLVPGQSANDVFRWVHDFFGHSKEGFQFGPRGEFNAWRAHSEMYSPEAQGALAGETLAQNSWVNFGPQVEGKNIPLAERPFAEQKNVIVPPELISEAGRFQPRTESGRALEEKGYEIVETGEMGTRRVIILDKNKEAIAQIQSVQLSPKKAEISFVSKKKGAPAGLGEVLYREVGSRLRDDGVTSLGGHVIRPEPLAIRKKIFGGFKKLTVNDEPATYAEAIATAERLNYTDTGTHEVAAIEPVNQITAATKFLPGKRDAQGRPLDKEGNIDYVKWQAESIVANKKRRAEPIAKSVPKGKASIDLGTATGWVLPNKEFVPLDAAFHEQYLANNAAELNKKFKTNFSETPSVDDRLDALNAGFVRLRNQGGSMRVEANAERWRDLKTTVLDTLTDREGKIDNLVISLLNRKGQQVDSASAPRLQELSGPEKFQAISDAVGSLRSGGTGAFLPKGEYWLDPDGKFIRAPNGHFNKASEILKDKFGEEGGFLSDADSEATDTLMKKGYSRVISGDTEFHAESMKRGLSDLNSKQRNAIEDEVLKRGQELVFNGKYIGGGAFLPAEGGLPGIGIQTKEEAGRAKAARRISTVKKNNPEAVAPQYARDETGEIIVTPDGTPKPLTLDYNFIDSPLAKEAAKGLKGVKREEAAAVALGDELVKVYREVEKNPDIKAGAKWYSTARTRLKKVFGDDAKFFAELLGATSARTPVDINYRFALDAYNQFKAGAYDKTLAKYREGKKAWETQDLGDFPGGEDATRGQFIDWWVNEHDLGVTQSNGKKFGMNSRAVLRVLDGSWAAEVQGPKTPNFAGNLTGETFEATIDVWAARTLHRLANEGGKNRWRILPENETGVTDTDFYLGQAAYRDAAKKLGIKPDALQAVLWFAEKEHWEKKGWTRGAGAAKSDFNVLLAETERAPSGELRMKTPQAEFGLDFSAKASDLKKKR